MPELADIFRRYGGEYLDKFGANILPSHRRALWDILHCRTEVLGGHLYRCDQCSHEVYVYHSCRNRSCPKCHGPSTEAWLDKRRAELLPVEHFHVTFTLPAALRELVRRHQKTLYGVLMKSAAQALMKLAADPKYVGGQIGILAVLHTWGRTLPYHPHVHCLVPGGGVSADQEWLPARKGFLVPVRALSEIFRGIFMEMAAAKLPDVTIPKTVYDHPWVVHCKPCPHGPQKVLDYLGRYVHRVAIPNSRILSIDDGRVCFRYQNCDSRQWKTMTLPAMEFIRRFLQHVLPKGVHKVRYYGFWAPSNRARLRRIQIALADSVPGSLLPATPDDLAPMAFVPIANDQPCPHCQTGHLVRVGPIPRRGRPPP